MNKTPEEIFEEKMVEIRKKHQIGWKKGLLNLLSISIASVIIALGKGFLMPSQVPNEVSNKEHFIQIEIITNACIIFILLAAIYAFYGFKKLSQFNIESTKAKDEMQIQMLKNLKQKQPVKTKQPQKTK